MSDVVLTIGMPAYNEEACIEPAVRACLDVLDQIKGRGELLVINDGSTDGTGAILEKLAKVDDRLRVITFPENRGIASFNRRLFQEAKGEWVYFICSDGQADYEDIVRFLSIAETGDWDAVLGYRRKKHYTPYRRFVSWMFKILTLILFGTHYRDAGWVRLLRRSLYAPLPTYSDSAFGMAEHVLVGLHLGARQLEVAVGHNKRLTGEAKSGSLARVFLSFFDLVATRIRWVHFEQYYHPSKHK